MNLTPAQLTLLKTHLNANTNTITPTDGSTAPFVVNQALAGGDPTIQGFIAGWYNGLGLAGDNQQFTNLFLWNPNTTAAQLSTAINHPDTPVHGLSGTPTLDQQLLAVNNAYWRWDGMIRAGFIDMTDPQVRLGVRTVWGDGSQTAKNIGAVAGVLCGKNAGRRIELVLSPVPVDAVVGTWAGAHVCPKDAKGLQIIGQSLTAADVANALANG